MRRAPPAALAQRAPREQFSSALWRNSGGAPGDLRGLFAAMRRYIEHLGVKGYTEVGRYNAERYVREFIRWADERGVTHPQQVSRAVLERYQRWLFHRRKKDGSPLHVRSQRAKVIPLKGYFRWLTKTGEIPANPATDLDLPREVKRLPQAVLTAEEAERVLTLPDLATPTGLRDRTMLEVLYATGIRRMEIANLLVTDVDFERCVVFVRQGKGGKDRLIPLGERAAWWVQRYLDEARSQLAWNADDATLFLTREGLRMNLAWMSTQLTQYVVRAGIGKKGGCHLWRHTMATLMLEGGADIRFIQAMLGHADINSTQIYTQVAIRQLQQVHAMTHPATKRRARGEQMRLDMPMDQDGGDGGAESLLEALAVEAEEEDALQDDERAAPAV